MKRTLVIVSLLLFAISVSVFSQQRFSANCASGQVSATNWTVNGGTVKHPAWWKAGHIWRIGNPLDVNFTIPGNIPYYIELSVQHTGSWDKDENSYTVARIQVNDHAIVDSYIAPEHMEVADTFRIPRAFLRRGSNSTVFSLAGGDFVWWIRNIEATW